MAKQVGRLTKIGFAKQTTRGTAANAPTFFLPRTDLSFADIPESVINENTVNVLDNVLTKENVSFSSEGSVGGNLDLTNIGHVLFALFSSVTTTGTNPKFTHVFSNSQTALSQQYTAFVEDGVDTKRFPNCVCTGFEMSFGVGELITYSANFMGSKSSTGSTLVSAFASDLQYPTQKHISATYGGTAVSVRSGSVNFEKSAEADINVGRDTPSDYLTTMFSVSGNLSFYLDDDTFKEEMLDSEKKDIVLTIMLSADKSLSLVLKNCSVDAFTPDYSAGSVVEVSVDFAVTYDVTAGYTVQATLKNAQSAY